jgi:hypothetical protein
MREYRRRAERVRTIGMTDDRGPDAKNESTVTNGMKKAFG